MKWIDAAKELPPYDEAVIVAYGNDKDVCFNHRSDNPNVAVDEDGWCTLGYATKVTHWLRLPQIKANGAKRGYERGWRDALDATFKFMASHASDYDVHMGGWENFKEFIANGGKLTRERKAYMEKCKHYSNDHCNKKSGWYCGLHFIYACDGNCRRMKKYDKNENQG